MAQEIARSLTGPIELPKAPRSEGPAPASAAPEPQPAPAPKAEGDRVGLMDRAKAMLEQVVPAYGESMALIDAAGEAALGVKGVVAGEEGGLTQALTGAQQGLGQGAALTQRAKDLAQAMGVNAEGKAAQVLGQVAARAGQGQELAGAALALQGAAQQGLEGAKAVSQGITQLQGGDLAGADGVLAGGQQTAQQLKAMAGTVGRTASQFGLPPESKVFKASVKLEALTDRGATTLGAALQGKAATQAALGAAEQGQAAIAQLAEGNTEGAKALQQSAVALGQQSAAALGQVAAGAQALGLKADAKAAKALAKGQAVAQGAASVAEQVGRLQDQAAQGVAAAEGLGQAQQALAEGQVGQAASLGHDAAQQLLGQASGAIGAVQGIAGTLGAKGDAKGMKALGLAQKATERGQQGLTAAKGLTDAANTGRQAMEQLQAAALESASSGDWLAGAGAANLAVGAVAGATLSAVDQVKALGQAAGVTAKAPAKLAKAGEKVLTGVSRAQAASAAIAKTAEGVQQVAAKGQAASEGLSALASGEVAEGLLSAGQATVDVISGVKDTGSTVHSGLKAVGVGESKVAKALDGANQRLAQGKLNTGLGVAGGALGALGGGLQVAKGVQQLAKGELVDGATTAVGGASALAQGVGQAAQSLAPAGRIASAMGGRVVPVLGVVSGAVQGLQALKKDPPDVKSAATGAMTAVGSALLPFPPAGTVVGGALVAGAAIADNWDTITSVAGKVNAKAGEQLTKMGQSVGDGAVAAGQAVAASTQKAAQAVRSWFSR